MKSGRQRVEKKNYSYLNIQIFVDLNEESETKEKKIILLVHKIEQATGNIKGYKKSLHIIFNQMVLILRLIISNVHWLVKLR